jgi:uncharacterized membrane protein
MIKKIAIAIIVITIISILMMLSGVRVEHHVVQEPIKGISTTKIVNSVAGKTNMVTRITYGNEEVEIRRENYSSDEEYFQTVEKTKKKYGIK